MKKLRKTIVERYPEYFFHPTMYWTCKFCEFRAERPDTDHILKHHKEECDLFQHMEAHTKGKCKCSGSVVEI